MRKVFFFLELSRHFGRQRVVLSLKLLAMRPGTWENKIDKVRYFSPKLFFNYVFKLFADC